MKLLFSWLLGLTATTHVQAQSVLGVDSVCIHQLDATGPQPQNTSFGSNFLEETDLGQFSLMGDIEKEFSQARSLMVCHDEERIYGLQLSIKMHRFKYRNEEMLIEKYQLSDYYDHVDEMVRNSKPRRMSLIGSQIQNCETTKIFQYGHVKTIEVLSDNTGIRGMKMKLTNGSQFFYGSAYNEQTMTMKEFHFEQGRQLLGIHGKVAYERGNPKGDTLLTVGFFRDECSDTTQLFMSKQTQRDFIAMEAQKLNAGRVQEKQDTQGIYMTEIVFSVFLVMSIVILIICYRKQCKNQQQSQAHQNIPIPELDSTPNTPQRPKAAIFNPIIDDSHRSVTQNPTFIGVEESQRTSPNASVRKY